MERTQKSFRDCSDGFLREYSPLVKENTLRRYENDLTLFFLYLERRNFKEMYRFSWDQIEEFFSCWYLRQCAEPTVSCARGLFATIKKFCFWLDQNEIVSLSQSWNSSRYRTLKENVERVLMWEREAGEERPFDVTRVFEKNLEQIEVPEGRFRVIHVLNNKAAIKDMNNDSSFIVRFEGMIADFIQPGDIVSSFLCRDERGLYVSDDIIRFLYPPMAEAYMR